jgi:hypothetical protein
MSCARRTAHGAQRLTAGASDDIRHTFVLAQLIAQLIAQ